MCSAISAAVLLHVGIAYSSFARHAPTRERPDSPSVPSSEAPQAPRSAERSRVNRGGWRQTLRVRRGGLVPSGLPSELIPLLVTAPGGYDLAGASIYVILDPTASHPLRRYYVLRRPTGAVSAGSDRRSHGYTFSRGSRGDSDRRGRRFRVDVRRFEQLATWAASLFREASGEAPASERQRSPELPL